MLFGVFDGHGGDDVAKFTEIHFQKILEDNDDFKKGNYKEALRKSFHDLDKLVSSESFA